jgi:hypothetical protein
MKFWRLIRPDSGSISQDRIINGFLDHPYGLPGVHCERCRKTWGGCRIHPFSCPEKFIKRKEINNAWPISGKEHQTLRKEIEHELSENNIKATLLPGDHFQPGFLEISGPPRTDVLWSRLESMCVSERLKCIIENNNLSGVSFLPIIKKKIGKGKAKKLPIKIIDNDEEIEIELNSHIEPNDNYFELLITSESKLPLGVENISVCNYCGRKETNNTKRQLKMTEKMWNGDDIFFLSTTLWPIVTDKVKNIFLENKISNIWMKRVD